MVRPSQNTDQRLIQAALDLLPETGFSGLKLRKVAEKAKVNLGMFNYHFKNKEAFCEKVMEEYYERFYSHFSFEAAKGKDADERLKNAFTTLARFVRDNRKLLLALGRDVMDQHQPTIRFIENNFHRHVSILLQIIQEARKSGNLKKDVPLPIEGVFLAVSMVGPNIVAALLERIKLKPQYDWLKAIIIPLMLSDRAIDMRLNLAMDALKPKMTVAQRNKSKVKKGLDEGDQK